MTILADVYYCIVSQLLTGALVLQLHKMGPRVGWVLMAVHEREDRSNKRAKLHFEGNGKVLHELLATQDANTGTWTATHNTSRACYEFLAGGEDEAEYDLSCAVGLSSAELLLIGSCAGWHA
jgi:hypothetical protein